MKTKNLTLKEALESGYPFKRRWEGEQEWVSPNDSLSHLGKEDIIATDWEIYTEPEKPREYEGIEKVVYKITGIGYSVYFDSPKTLVEKKEGWVVVNEENLKGALHEALCGGLDGRGFNIGREIERLVKKSRGEQ